MDGGACQATSFGRKKGLAQEEIGISINKKIYALGSKVLSKILYTLC